MLRTEWRSGRRSRSGAVAAAFGPGAITLTFNSTAATDGLASASQTSDSPQSSTGPSCAGRNPSIPVPGPTSHFEIASVRWPQGDPNEQDDIAVEVLAEEEQRAAQRCVQCRPGFALDQGHHQCLIPTTNTDQNQARPPRLRRARRRGFALKVGKPNYVTRKSGASRSYAISVRRSPAGHLWSAK